MAQTKIRVVVVDDSAFMRMVLKDIIDSQPDMQVVGVAKDGLEALQLIEEKKPDVVTLDVEMPRMNGIEVLKRIAQRYPVRVIMVSSLTEEGADITITALTLGAVDFLTKPSGSTSLTFREVADTLVSKIRNAMLVDPKSVLTKKIARPTVARIKMPLLGNKAVVIGASTGGPRSLDVIVPALPEDFPAPIFLVQHMPPVFTKSLAMRLNSISKVRVKEAEDGEPVNKGTVYVAPGDFHLGVRTMNSTVQLYLDKSEKINNVRPCCGFHADESRRNLQKQHHCGHTDWNGKGWHQGCFHGKVLWWESHRGARIHVCGLWNAKGCCGGRIRRLHTSC